MSGTGVHWGLSVLTSGGIDPTGQDHPRQDDPRPIRGGAVDWTSLSLGQVGPAHSNRETVATARSSSRQLAHFLANRRAVARILGVGAVLVVLSAAFLFAVWSGALATALMILFFANCAALALGCMITHRILMGSIRYRAEKTHSRAIEAIEARLRNSG